MTSLGRVLGSGARVDFALTKFAELDSVKINVLHSNHIESIW